ncbi:hypothetical protein Hanom_Chr17g01542451 [Helianthus anomalus]
MSYDIASDLTAHVSRTLKYLHCSPKTYPTITYTVPHLSTLSHSQPIQNLPRAHQKKDKILQSGPTPQYASPSQLTSSISHLRKLRSASQSPIKTLTRTPAANIHHLPERIIGLSFPLISGDHSAGVRT